jgi:isopentenyl diphosphate isomerase/L-lactate dehydrogenase-like FMN-dependent dehydrogenase
MPGAYTGGVEGVPRVLRVLRREFETVMRHMGAPDVASISESFLQPR